MYLTSIHIQSCVSVVLKCLVLILKSIFVKIRGVNTTWVLIHKSCTEGT